MSAWQDAEEHAQRAHQHFQAGEWEHALTELHAALDEHPDRSEWHVGLGLTLDALERYREAAQAFATAVQLGGEDASVLLYLGIDLVRCGEPQQAIDALNRLNQLQPLQELGYVHRILAYALLDQHDDAEVMFYLAGDVAQNAARDDASPAALANAGGPTARAAAHDHLAQSMLLRRPADPDRAVWCWQEALQHDPQHPSAHRQLARLLRHRGHTTRAAEHFVTHLKHRPDDTAARLDHADMLREEGLWAQASDQYRHALTFNPTLAYAHLQLGELALSSGHPDAARDRFHRALQLDPNGLGIHLGLARAALVSGYKRRARRLLHEELDLEGHTAHQHVDIAELLVQLSLFTDAVTLLDPLLKTNPATPTSPPHTRGSRAILAQNDMLHSRALRYYGISLLALNRTAQGVTHLRHCTRLNPQDANALAHLARTALAAGDLPLARLWLTRGRDTAPKHTDLRQLQRQLLWAQIRTSVGLKKKKAPTRSQEADTAP